MKKLVFFCGVLLFPHFGFSFQDPCQSFLKPDAADSVVHEAVSDNRRVVHPGTAVCREQYSTNDVRQDTTETSKTFERLDSIVVSGSRAGMNTPVSFTQVSGKELQRGNSSHSLPMMLQLQPSVVATTEGGLGLGYTKLSVRGTDDTRTNVTLNGIAMNDSESQQVFWVNIPAMQSFLNSAQLQRGVGTSSNGSGAFGASLNFETKLSGRKPYGLAEVSVGSYNTHLSTIGVGTGVSQKGFSFDMVYTRGETDGYIRNAKADLNSLYAVAGWQNGSDQLKLSYILGDQCTGITWEGISLDMYENDRRYNVAGEYYDDAGNLHYYDNETDNYRQHYIQGAWNHSFSHFLTWNTTLNVTDGYGYYENYKYDTKFSKYGLQSDTESLKRSDFIVQQAMDNIYLAANSGLFYERGDWKVAGAVSWGQYNGDHFGDVVWCKHLPLQEDYRWYQNNGRKQDFSAYVRAENSSIDKFTFFLDLQYRGVSYELDGADKDFALLNWKEQYNFFNPKAGFTYTPDNNSRIYASVAVAHREPSRSDIKESIKSGSASGLKAEQLVDAEFGYRFSSSDFSLAANLYFMEYKDQLVSTGRLSDVGYVIKENIPVSYRRGIEVSAGWQVSPFVRLDANCTLSGNKAVNYTAYVDTYDNPDNWNPEPQTEVFFRRTNLVLSPEIVGMALVSVTPGGGWDFSLSGKYVGKQYMDNFNTVESEVPAYFVSSLRVLKGFRLRRYGADDHIVGNRDLEVSLNIDNLTNNRYYSYGWIYQARFADGSSPYIEQGVYAQAPINFMLKLAYKF